MRDGDFIGEVGLQGESSKGLDSLSERAENLLWLNLKGFLGDDRSVLVNAHEVH